MNKRKLGSTDIELSELGYGATALFGKNVLGKKGITDDHALSLINTAIVCGINFFDTGFNYGYAEERLGRCLQNAMRGGATRREDIIIQTKGCETLNPDGSYGPNDYSRDWIKRSVDISLNRLKIDYIDMYALHSATPEVVSDELIHLFEDLKSQSIIRAYGVAGVSDDLGNWICDHKCFDYVMMTYNYAEARRNALIEKLNKNNIGIITGGSLNRSLSTFSPIPHSFNDIWRVARVVKNRREDLKRTKKFSFVNNVEGMTPQQVSLAYVLNNKNITSAVFNTVNTGHLESNADVVGKKLSADVIKRIEQEGMQ